ncbi:MAG: TniB family NTP-binding protein [Burkholderiales bacterium]
MTASKAEFPHLKGKSQEAILAPDAERIRFIQQGTWIGYDRAKEAIEELETLLAYPPTTRMPNMLLVAPSFNGKTSILKHFQAKHPADIDPEGEATICAVVFAESPPKPDISALYSRILEALMAPFKSTARAEDKYAQIKQLFRKMRVRMLILDEIHHLITGSTSRQQEYRNALKSLGNETQIVIVAAGIEDAYNAFNADPQMSSRFTPFELPTWKLDHELARMLATLETRLPLKKPSDLKSEALMLAIYDRSEGTLGDICDLVKVLAVDAIKSGKEQILFDRVGKIRWTPPSRRKQYKRI